MRKNKGFTLIEIIVAVALVAILSAAIAPSVLNNIAQGRVARCQSDVQAIASAISMFRQQVGVIPNMANPGDTPANWTYFDFLASHGPTANWNFAAGDGFWSANAATSSSGKGQPNWEEGAVGFSSGGGDATCEPITHHLMLGKSLATTNEEYHRVTPGKESDPTLIGFRSSLISSDPLDPWNHRYLVNVGAFGSTGAVWVISAGPDGEFDTFVEQTGLGADSLLGDDDVGYRIQ